MSTSPRANHLRSRSRKIPAAAPPAALNAMDSGRICFVLLEHHGNITGTSRQNSTRDAEGAGRSGKAAEQQATHMGGTFVDGGVRRVGESALILLQGQVQGEISAGSPC